MGGAFGGKETQAALCGGARRAGGAQDRAAVQVPPRPRRRHDPDRQAPRFRVDYEVGFDDDGRLAARRHRCSPRAAAIPPTCPARSTTAPCSTPTTPIILPAARIVSHRMQDQHGLQHRLPRLRRAAGHDGDRAGDRRHRMVAWATIRSMCARPISTAPGRDMTPYGRRSTDNIAPELIDGAGGVVRLSRAAQGGRGIQCREPRSSSAASR